MFDRTNLMGYCDLHINSNNQNQFVLPHLTQRAVSTSVKGR